MKTTFKLLVILILCSLLFGINENLNGQSNDFSFNPEPGKCYAKCAILDKYRTVKETFVVLIEDSNENAQLDSIYFRIEEKSGDTIYLGYKKELNNTQLNNIDHLEKIIIVENESEIDNYIEKTITYQVLEKKGGFTNWVEVLCADRINKRILKRLQESLILNGYLDYSEPIKELTNKLKKALKRYQVDNGLPVGQLDIETLELLNVKF